ncbi:hypothetical protein Lal_00036486 [Lupinus albus]|nr:hypothetical protein Lal_00036486 [Lupinus albus]
MVGSNNIPVSLLQFVDDTILIGDGSDANTWVMKSVLQLFELSSGLKINFSKSNLFGVNIKEDTINMHSAFLHWGGLGVKDIRFFNFDLLGKWKWRLLTERDSLWCKVFFSKYGHNSNNHNGVGFRSSLSKQLAWARDLDLSSPSESVVDNWFWDGLVRQVGDGSNTSFWYDNWVWSSSLCSKYRRLFNLSTSPNDNICNFGSWVGESWEWKVPWRRRLFTWEHELCNSFLNDLKQHASSLWKSKAPSKVLTFTWRLFQDKIPTKDALSKRGVPLHTNGRLLCSFCNDHSETSTHLFSSCSVTYSVWQSIYKWLGIHVVLPLNPLHHFLNHIGMVSDKKSWKVWSSIWLATIWAIWLHRNDIIFNNIQTTTNRILDTARVNVWLWCKSVSGKISISYSDWISKPSECLNFIL